MQLRDDQVRRYARHVLLPDIGGVGQARLLAARARVDARDGVTVAYLAAAGVGTLELTGDGPVDADDLRTNPLVGAADLGRSRVDAARDRIAALNPDVTVVRADGDAGSPTAPTMARALIDQGGDACRIIAALARP